MENIVKKDVFVPSDEALAYGHFNSASGQVCFRQNPAMVFVGHFDCQAYQKAKMIEYLKTGQLRVGSECISGSGMSVVWLPRQQRVYRMIHS